MSDNDRAVHTIYDENVDLIVAALDRLTAATNGPTASRWPSPDDEAAVGELGLALMPEFIARENVASIGNADQWVADEDAARAILERLAKR